MTEREPWPVNGGEVGALIRTSRWEGTPLGAIETWSATLRSSVDLVLASPVAAVVLWGPDCIQIYNDRWHRVHAGKHPAALGQRTHECFAELVGDLEPVYQRVHRGDGIVLTDSLLPVLRDGVLEDAWWNVVYTPIRGVGGAVDGIFCTLAETTTMVLAQRARNAADLALHVSQDRQDLLLELSDAMRPILEPVELQQMAMKLLVEFLDVMRATYFEVEADQDSFSASARYERDPAPLPVQLRMSDFSPDLAQAYRAGRTLTIDDTETQVEVESQREAYRAIGIRAWVGVPLVKRDQLVAIVGVHSRAPRRWSETEVRFIEEVAERTWDAAIRARAETALRANEQRLQRLALDLSDADRRKNEFLATLAHELRNPLAPIRTSLQLLQIAREDPDTLTYALEVMERQVINLVRLVDDLMEVSRITRGTIELRKERVEIASIIRSAVETSRPLIDTGRHDLRVSIRDEPLIVEVDPVRIAQALSNLLNNAAKYTDPGGRICLSAVRDGSHAVVTVRDSGMGIPVAMLLKVFELFTQVDRNDPRAQGGLGIGLTLVRSLVDLHGGNVEAKSTGLGQGSELVVRLPLVDAPRPAVIRASAPRVRVEARQRILVVDDNRDAANSMRMLLRALGSDVEVAHDGSSALVALTRFRPSVVLLDIGMPGMSGYEVARRARRAPEGQVVTIIAITGWGQAEDRMRSKHAGIDHHLVKPVDVDELKALLAAA